MAGFKSIFRTLTTDTATTDVEGVGRLRWEDDKCYRWVQNTITNFTPVAGDLVCHAFLDGVDAKKKISKPATATLGFLGGVACATISASTGTNPAMYGWIQVWGPGSVNVTPVNTQTTSNPVAGNALVAGNAVVYAATGAAMGTAPIYTRKLVLNDIVLGSTAVQLCSVDVQCL